MNGDFFDLSALNSDRLEQRTIDQLADGFRDLKANRHPETAERYRAETGFFFNFMRRFGADPAAPTQPHVLRYLDYLASKVHPDHPGDCWHECQHLPYEASSRQHRLDVLSAFYDHAIANGLPLAANPCTGLSVYVPATDYIDHLTEEETHVLWNGARRRSHREGALIALLVGCGMRKEEARLVRVENLGRNSFGPTLRFWRVKGRYWQTINLPVPVAAAVHLQAGDRTRGALLPSPRWTVTDDGIREKAHLTDTGIDDILKRLTADVQVRPHDFHSHLGRKTAITMARTIPGLALETTMVFFGHATLKDHQKYDAFAKDTFKHPIYNPVQGTPAQCREFWRLTA
ncbi:tyrosine-type recombinase/integrase [Streptomyces sp. NPDC058257]|uniref:tyrosine-type recombinase/integrase n=1 Tax=Streptomyces sp. NPDC058257 TaxID=3346409 RepID=UPI0036F12BC4